MLTLYTNKDCPACEAMKQHLTDSGVPFQVRNIAEDKSARNYLMSKGILTVPVLEHCVMHVGYDKEKVNEFISNTQGSVL